NYDSLRNIALQTAGLLHFKFDTLDRYYHPTRGIILPDDHEDDMWAGQYLFRRFGDDVVSIEMRHVYIDTALHNEMEKEKFYADTTKMFVFAMMYPERSKADSLAQQLKPNFASTKVIAAKIYMGCLH
ncbi:MAG TPA: hypothetical protein VL947_02005, partial [Cytophagales bacterium]|nr:hypothetical protein [Cytophagales bacterium]